jgi:pilus assembly protein FimV
MMSWKLRVAVSALLLAPQAALALGLGDIRVNSALNEPLSAEIELVAPTNEELNSMGAQLASRELFQRYGLDRPAYLDSVQFTVGRGRDGRNVLLVSSATPASEPFVTFLVELNWPRGRLLREYTVLLDPPVFAPKDAAPPAPVAAPRVSRPVAAPAPAAAPAPSRSAPVVAQQPETVGAPSSYRVQRGDTAYGIASRLSGGDRVAVNRTVIALFRANPEAFGGNVNLLLAGAILRVPGPEAVNAVDGREAAAEISRQTSAWRGGESVPETGRLRLVTPTEATPEVTPAADLETRIGQVNREVEESRRLLEIKQAELAQLQSRLAEQEKAAREAAAAAPVPEPAAGEAPVVEAPAPAAAPEPEPTTAAEREPAPSEPSFFESLTDNWSYLLGAAALLLGGGLIWGYVRRRREEDLDEAMRSFEMPASAPVPSETQRLRGLAVAATPAQPEIIVEERKPAARPSPALRKPEPSIDDTISTEAALDLDEGDPLAEADFHMAYGLYDQSADIIQAALEKEPERRDYKVKLLEIFFVSGNAEDFLEVARDLSESRGAGDAVEWDRIVIMGRQLAPEDPLFEGARPSGGVDLNLEGGASRVDLELLAMPEGEEGIDLDLGEALGAADSGADTGENAALDMNLDEAGEGEPPTVEMTATSFTAEMPTIEVPAGDAPTVKSPRIREGTGDTIREKVSPGQMGIDPVSADATAEMEMDDLGIDLSDFEALGEDQDDDGPTRLMPKDTGGALGGTATLPVLKDDTDEGGTAMLSALDEGLSEIDLELPDDLAGAGIDDTQRVDLDTGTPADGGATATERMSLSDLPQMSDLEPVTMSEVGTKLDLARAYVDMGDPDGARSILQEVLQEGSSQQKQDAQRLLDSLPGA